MHPQSSPASLLGEEWRPVVGWEDRYLISSLARVWSIFSGRPLSSRQGFSNEGGKRRDKYFYVTLTRDNKRKCAYVHVLVAEAFIGPRVPGQEANHRDLNKANNALSNLEYLTPKANTRHAWEALGRKGTKNFGVQNGFHRLTEETVREVRQRRAAGETYQSIANDLQIGRETIRHAVVGDTWQHVQ